MLAVAMITFTVAVSAVGFWKYAHFRYQGLDLAIYTNVLWNLSHGNGWWSSIQANSYLGDHVEPILLLIAPLFRLWPDARLLIVLQALALALTAIPVYLIFSIALARHVVGAREKAYAPGTIDDRAGMVGRWPSARAREEVGTSERAGRASVPGSVRPTPALSVAAPWIAALSLLNPLLWNAALFEFHALAFAPVLLLAAAAAYLRRRFTWFVLWLLLALTVREDVAFVIAMFGVVAAWDRWKERHRWWWMMTPLVLGIAWAIIAARIAAAHNLAGSYKFLVYYGWLVPRRIGEGGLRVVGEHIVTILRHLLTLGNFEMILGLLLPFALLPLLRPKWLILAIPSLLALVLAAPGGSAIVIESHYALAFLPALMLASADAIAAWRWQPHLAVRAWLAHQLPRFPVQFAMPLAAAWALATLIAFGPLPGIARAAVRGPSAEDRTRRTAYEELLARVPENAPIAASYAALPHVAARRDAYSMASAYLGVTQFSEAPFVLPDDTAYLLMDARDALAYAVQFPTIGWSAPHAASGPDRLRALIRERGFSVIAERDGVALLARGDVGSAFDERYLIPPRIPPRAYLGVDALRDVTVQRAQ